MNIIDISQLHKKFKTDTEKQQFMQAQHATIIDLTAKIKQKDEEIGQLKQLLINNTPLISEQPSVPATSERIIVSPEEALIEEQISLIQQRSYLKELSLEDVKKLDLLIKNKKLIKDDPSIIKGDFKNINVSNSELIKIAQNFSKDDK